MDPPAPVAQSDEEAGPSNAAAQKQPQQQEQQQQQPQQPQLNTTPAQPPTAAAAAPTQTASSMHAPDLNALQQGDLTSLPLQGMPTDLNLLPMFPQDGSLLTDDQLMNMSMMMPLVMDDGSMLNLPNMPNMPDMPAPAPIKITNDEIKLYDRQLRLWGMKAQENIRNANILLITMKGLGNEIAKNLVLAGIGALTIADHENVTAADLGAQFLISQEQIGQNRAMAALEEIKKLNPRVSVSVDTTDVRMKVASDFKPFSMIIATDLDPNALNIINTATRLCKRPFYAAGVHGLYGFIFADLIEHEFIIRREKSNVTTQPKLETRTREIVDVKINKEGDKAIEMVTKKELYSTWLLASDGAHLPEEFTRNKRRLKAVSPALPCLRALWEFQAQHGGRNPADKNDLAEFTRAATQKHKELSLPAETLTAEFLRSFLQNIGSEIAPVTAVLGGQLAQDVINVLAQTQQPIQNMVIFDGNTMEANLYPLHPMGLLGTRQLESALQDMGNGFDMPVPLPMNMAIPQMGAGMVNLNNLGTAPSMSNGGGMGNTVAMLGAGATSNAGGGPSAQSMGDGAQPSG